MDFKKMMNGFSRSHLSPGIKRGGFYGLLLLLSGIGYWLTFTFYPQLNLLTVWHSLCLYVTGISSKQTAILHLTLLFFILLPVWSYHRKSSHKAIFGDAHWATRMEIKRMGLFKSHDILIGWWGRRLLRAPLVSHLLVFAPSRSGKGVSQVIPNALAFKGSLLVLDIKQEIFEKTSGFRAANGQAVFLFSPGSVSNQTHCWNPLDSVSCHPGRMISDLQNLVEILVPKPDHTREDMWIDEARALALGLLLWLRESGRPFTLGELNHFIKGTPNLTEYLQTILDCSVMSQQRIHLNPTAYRNLNHFVQKADKEQSGVKSNLASNLTLWDDPYIVAATSRSDFDLCDLRKRPITVYLGVPTNQLERLAPLMNLFIQQFLSQMTESLPTSEEPHAVLAILDEFCALGVMLKLRKGLAFLAGFHVHLMLIIQNIGEFYHLYGKNSSDTFFQNTDIKIMYRQNDMADKIFVSKSLGDCTVPLSSQSRHRSRHTALSRSTSEQMIKRPLLLPDEVGNFSKAHAIAQCGGEAPIKFKRIIYYRDHLFKQRLLPPIAVPTIEPIYPAMMMPLPIREIVQKSVGEAEAQGQSISTFSADDDNFDDNEKNENELLAAIEVYEQCEI